MIKRWKKVKKIEMEKSEKRKILRGQRSDVGMPANR